jgi:hypothetical protein
MMAEISMRMRGLNRKSTKICPGFIHVSPLFKAQDEKGRLITNSSLRQMAGRSHECRIRSSILSEDTSKSHSLARFIDTYHSFQTTLRHQASQSIRRALQKIFMDNNPDEVWSRIKGSPLNEDARSVYPTCFL